MAIEFTDAQINKYCLILADKIKSSKKMYSGLYPVPMGGYPIAVKLSVLLNIPVVNEYFKNTLIVDDLIDSGKTLSTFTKNDKAVVFAKHKNCKKVTYYAERNIKDWITFPWDKENDIEREITRTLEYIGENPNREGLVATPKRIRKSWDKLFGGYNKNPKELLTTFDKETYDQMVVLKDIEMYSTCEHHFLPFFGKCHIAYIPNKKVIGVSKLARLMEIYARRMQIQERIGEQITTFIMKELKAKGAGCVIEAQHFCMTSRGVEKQKSIMITSSLKGAFLSNDKARAEFMGLVGG